MTFGDNILVHDRIIYILLCFENTKFLIIVVDLLIRILESIEFHFIVWVQTGTGHFSPIGGYHAGRDMVLMLDVARFKYPPHWIPLKLLWEAMDTIDEATGHRRGYAFLV